MSDTDIFQIMYVGVVDRMIQEATGLVRCSGITIWIAAAVLLGPSHPILGWAVRHTAWLVHTVPSGELKQDSPLFLVWARVLGRDRALRRDGVLQVRWDTRQAAPAMGGRRLRRHQRAHLRRTRSLCCLNDPQACSKWTLVQRQNPTDGQNF